MKRVRAREVERRRIKKELWSMDSSRGSPPRQLIVSLPFPLLVQTSSPLSIAIFSRALSAEFPFTSNRLREVRSRTNVSRVRYHRASYDSKLSLPTTIQAYGKMASRFYCFGPGRERPEPLEQHARFRSSFVHRLNAEFMRDLVARITLSVFIVAGTVNFNCSWQPVA